jgi:cell division protein FtsN
MRRPANKSSGAAGLFVLLGILTILGVTFAAGIYAGRIWATRPHPIAVAAAAAERETGRRGVDARAAKVPDPGPRLTFYHELTAPLTAPPPPPKPAKTSPPPLVASRLLPERDKQDVKEKEAPPTSAARDGSTTISSRPPTPQAGLASPAPTIPTSGTHRFTVQVAAYKARPPADALRASLAASGHDARVVETDASNGVRYRVQIGDFASRDAARDAAARLAGPTFVTTR